MSDRGVREIRLLGVPADVFIESQNHQHDLIRELVLIDMGSRFEIMSAGLSHELARLIRDVLNHYADFRSSTRQQALDALERGESSVDLVMHGGEDLVPALRRWLALVERADAVCAEGATLTLVARPAVRRLRRWYVDAVDTAYRTGTAPRWPNAVSSTT